MQKNCAPIALLLILAGCPTVRADELSYSTETCVQATQTMPLDELRFALQALATRYHEMGDNAAFTKIGSLIKDFEGSIASDNSIHAVLTACDTLSAALCELVLTGDAGDHGTGVRSNRGLSPETVYANIQERIDWLTKVACSKKSAAAQALRSTVKALGTVTERAWPYMVAFAYWTYNTPADKVYPCQQWLKNIHGVDENGKPRYFGKGVRKVVLGGDISNPPSAEQIKNVEEQGFKVAKEAGISPDMWNAFGLLDGKADAIWKAPFLAIAAKRIAEDLQAAGGYTLKKLCCAAQKTKLATRMPHASVQGVHRKLTKRVADILATYGHSGSIDAQELIALADQHDAEKLEAAIHRAMAAATNRGSVATLADILHELR